MAVRDTPLRDPGTCRSLMALLIKSATPMMNIGGRKADRKSKSSKYGSQGHLPEDKGRSLLANTHHETYCCDRVLENDQASKKQHHRLSFARAAVRG